MCCGRGGASCGSGIEYLLTGRGPLSLSINHGGGFFRTRPDLPRPNMQLYLQAFSTLIPRDGERPMLTPDPFSGMSIGLVELPPDQPGAYPDRVSRPAGASGDLANAYSTDHDVQEMLAAVKFLRRIAAQEPLRDLIAEELRPGPDVPDRRGVDRGFPGAERDGLSPVLHVPDGTGGAGGCG